GRGQEGGSADRPATRVQGEGGLSGKDKGVALLNRVGRPGLKDRITRIAYGKGRLPSRGAELVVGNQGIGGVLQHGSGAARRGNEFARVCEPPGTGIEREIGPRGARRQRRNAQTAGQAKRAEKHASSQVSRIS